MYGPYSTYSAQYDGHRYVTGYNGPDHVTSNQTYYASYDGTKSYYGTDYYSPTSFVNYGNYYNGNMGINYIAYRNDSPGTDISYVSRYFADTGTQSIQSYNNGYYYSNANNSGFSYYGGGYYGGYYGGFGTGYYGGGYSGFGYTGAGYYGGGYYGGGYYNSYYGSYSGGGYYNSYYGSYY